jgi:hypothetical protein
MGRRTDARLKRVNWGHYHSSIFGSTEMIDPAVVLQAALPPERLRYNIQEEMALAPRPVAGMALMLVGFIDHPDAFRSESFGHGRKTLEIWKA